MGKSNYRERALKIKSVPEDVFKKVRLEKKFSDFNCTISCDLPNSFLYKFNGKIKFPRSSEHYINSKQLLWKV